VPLFVQTIEHLIDQLLLFYGGPLNVVQEDFADLREDLEHLLEGVVAHMGIGAHNRAQMLIFELCPMQR